MTIFLFHVSAEVLFLHLNVEPQPDACKATKHTLTKAHKAPTPAAIFFLSQVLTAIYPAQTVALTAGVMPVANMAPAAAAAPAQDLVRPSSPKATGVQMPHPSMELESKVEVKREIQSEGLDEDGGYGYCGSMANAALATAGTASLPFHSTFSSKAEPSVGDGRCGRVSIELDECTLFNVSVPNCLFK